MVKVHVAIQGGGAKLMAILAVLEALANLEKEEQLEVLSFSGTSAGAICASLYARGSTVAKGHDGKQPDRKERSLSVQVKLRETKQELFGDRGRRLSSDFKNPPLWRAGLRYALSNPIWETKELERWLSAEFQSRKFSDLSIPVRVLSTSLGKSQPRIHGGGDDIQESLLASAGLPFFFRSWSRSGEVDVDGGLCENLPVELLPQDAPTIAISFKPEISENPRNPIAFAKALLTAAIDNSVARAKRRLDPRHLHEIDTTLGTFDFAKAFHKDFNNEYELIRERAEKFFVKFKEEQEKISSRQQDQYCNPEYWSDQNPRLKATLERVAQIYEKQHGDTKIAMHECRYEVVASSLRKENEKSKIVSRCVFSAIDKPIYCTMNIFTTKDPSELFAKSFWEVLDEKKNPVGTMHVPVRQAEDMTSRRGVLLYYLKPLFPQAGPYRERITEEVVLRPEDFDELSFTPDKAQGAIGLFELVLHVPLEIKGVRFIAKPDRPERLRGEPMPEERVKAIRESRDDLRDFYTIGWTIRDSEFPPGSAFAVDIVGPLTSKRT